MVFRYGCIQERVPLPIIIGERVLQNSIDQGNKARELKSMLLPTILAEDEYIRVGSKGDGGYILAKSVLKNAKYLISGGIEDNNDFELQIANNGIPGVQFDNSIDSPPKSHDLLTFQRATLGGNGGLSLHQILEGVDEGENIILKLDIEGSEYDFLSNIKSFESYSALVVELHNLNRIVNDDFYIKLKDILLIINTELVPVNLNANNCCGFSNIGGVAIPRVLEVTWISKKYLPLLQINQSARKLSNLNRPNISNRAPIDMNRFFNSCLIRKSVNYFRRLFA